MQEMGKEISLLSLTIAGWLMVRHFEADGLAPGLVPFRAGKQLLLIFQQPSWVSLCVMIGTASKGKLQSWLMWWAHVSTVINDNVCVRTRVFEWCIFYLVRSLCASVHTAYSVAAGCYYTLLCPTSHPWCQKHSPPALHLHFKRPAGKRRAPHFY